MALGKPVIATGYSGNMDFMNSENSILVPYNLVPVGDDAFPYPKDSYWALVAAAAGVGNAGKSFADNTLIQRRVGEEKAGLIIIIRNAVRLKPDSIKMSTAAADTIVTALCDGD
mgnify:CR=1 FL=1